MREILLFSFKYGCLQFSSFEGYQIPFSGSRVEFLLAVFPCKFFDDNCRDISFLFINFRPYLLNFCSLRKGVRQGTKRSNLLVLKEDCTQAFSFHPGDRPCPRHRHHHRPRQIIDAGSWPPSQKHESHASER